MKKLENMIALVTVGTSGIGLGTAKRFAREGALVYITGRRQAELDGAVREIGENSRGVQGDVSNLEDLDRLFATIKDEKGTLNVLFANAGWGEYAALGSITAEHFDKTFAINVKGVVFTAQKALPLLKRRRCDCHQRLDGQPFGSARVQYLFGDESSRAFVCPKLVN